MSYRPKIKTDANGTIKDLAIDAETVKGFTIGKSVPANAALTDTWRDVSVDGILIADQNKGHGFNFQAGMGLHVTGEDDADINITYALNDAYGDSKNPYASKTKNTVLAAPSSANGTPSFRALVSNDIPSLAASKITSGTFAAARIPSLDASKITSGTLSASRLPTTNYWTGTKYNLNSGDYSTGKTSEITFYGYVLNIPASHIVKVCGTLMCRRYDSGDGTYYDFPVAHLTQLVGVEQSKLAGEGIIGTTSYLTDSNNSLTGYGGFGYLNSAKRAECCRMYEPGSGAVGSWSWGTLANHVIQIDWTIRYND